MTDPCPAVSNNGKVTAQALRVWGDLMCLWRLCAKPGCARARACRGNAWRCFPRNFRLLPDGVQAWFEGVGELQKQGLPFDDAMEQLNAEDEGAALRDWYGAVSLSLGEEKTELPWRWWEAK
jgi:hypothetical protein